MTSNAQQGPHPRRFTRPNISDGAECALADSEESCTFAAPLGYLPRVSLEPALPDSPLAVLTVGPFSVVLRGAMRADVPFVVGLLADDPLGCSRELADGDESDGLDPYMLAFEMIQDDPGQLLVVAADGEAVVGTMQLSFIPGLSRRGSLRAQIEAVRVRADYRDRGLGRMMFEWAIAEARGRGCSLVQLTTDKTREDARRFYERLGFVASHHGMKLLL
jgi:ribosomal protein S18 acetylase RimI-like enzyme